MNADKQVVWVSVTNIPYVYHLELRCSQAKRRELKAIPTTEQAALLAGLRLCKNCSHLEDTLRKLAKESKYA